MEGKRWTTLKEWEPAHYHDKPKDELRSEVDSQVRRGADHQERENHYKGRGKAAGTRQNRQVREEEKRTGCNGPVNRKEGERRAVGHQGVPLGKSEKSLVRRGDNRVKPRGRAKEERRDHRPLKSSGSTKREEV